MMALEVSSTPPTWAGIITAAATLVLAITALLGGITALIKVFLPMKRTVSTVHKIVNQQRTDLINYQHALTSKLKDAGIEIPEDQSSVPIE